jgi:hypothetical protein
MKSKTRIKSKPNKAIKELEKINKSMRGDSSVKVGLPKGSNDYPDGTSVVMVGAVHEFGSPSKSIPQRSFLRSTMKENRKKYLRFFASLSKKIIQGKMNKKKALNLIGLKVQSDVVQKITDIKSPELKSRDGNPLVDTGHLRQSIIYKVGN